MPDLPRPQVERRSSEGIEVDMLWLDHRLVVELDGHALPPHTRGVRG